METQGQDSKEKKMLKVSMDNKWMLKLSMTMKKSLVYSLDER